MRKLICLKIKDFQPIKNLIVFNILIFFIIVFSSFASAVILDKSKVPICFDFEGDNATELNVMSETGLYNLTKEDTPWHGAHSQCVSGNCYYFSKVDDFEGTLLDPDQNDDGYCMWFWGWVNVTNVHKQMMQSVASGGGGTLEFKMAVDGLIDIDPPRGNGGNWANIAPYPAQRTELYTYCHNTTHDILWVNTTKYIRAGTTFVDSTGVFHLTAEGLTGNSFYGYMDNVGMSNRTEGFTQEIQEWLYNSGAGRTCDEIKNPAVDETPPNITNAICTSCYDGTNDTVDTTPTINVSVTDDTGISHVWISNSTTFAPNTTCTAGAGDDYICIPSSAMALTRYNVTSTYYFIANDTLGNIHPIYNLSIDVLLADINIPKSNISINNTSPKINGVVNISMNVSDGGELSYCWFYNNMSNANSALISLSGQSDHHLCHNIITINVSQGNHVLFIGYVNDTAGSINYSTIIITVANTVPSLTAILNSSPANLNYTNSTLWCFNITQSDPDGDALTLSYEWYNSSDGTTYDLMPYTDTNLTSGNTTKDQRFICQINVSDGTSQVRANSTSLTILNSFPFINDTVPDITANAGIAWSSPSINCTDVDGDTITYYVNGSRITVNSATGVLNDTPIEADGGNYAINASCDDGTINDSQIFTYTVTETVNPKSNISINNISAAINDVINISMNVSDGAALSHCLFWNNMSNENSSAILLSGTTDHHLCHNVTTINVSQGNHVLFIGFVNDSSGNWNYSRISMTVGNTFPPAPIIIYPLNNQYYSLATIDLNVSSTDDDNDIVTLYYFIDGALQTTSTTNSSYTGEGTFNFSVSAYDGIVFSANSSISFTLDVTNPAITNLSSDAFNFDNTTRILAINTTSIQLNISIFDLNLNYTILNVSNSTDVILSNHTNVTQNYFNYTDTLDTTNWRDYGNYTVFLWANDKAGNTHLEWYQFELYNSKPPTPTFVRPIDDETFTEEQILNITFETEAITDADGHIYTATVFIMSGSTNIANVSVNQTVTLGTNYFTFNQTNLSLGKYYINITTYDTTDENVINSTISGNFTILKELRPIQFLTEIYQYQNEGIVTTPATCNNVIPCNTSSNISVYNSITIPTINFKWNLYTSPVTEFNLSVDLESDGIEECSYINLITTDQSDNFSIYNCNLTYRFVKGIEHQKHNLSIDIIRKTNKSITINGSINLSYYPYTVNYTNLEVIDISLQTFNITYANLTNSTNVDSSIIYNGTTYDYLSKSIFAGYTQFLYRFNLPRTTNIDAIYNYSFYFNYNHTYPDKIEIRNSTIFEQEVYGFNLDNCTQNGAITLNITLKNETTNEFLTGTIDYSFIYWQSLNPSSIKNYSSKFYGTNQTFCIFPNWTTINSDVLFEYYIISPLFNYNAFNLSLTNKSQLIDLYIQDGTTQVLFTVQDTNSRPLERAYIHVLKYDVADNIYKVVEILKTDSQGQVLGNIILGTVFYNFIIYYQGILVYSEQAVKLIATTRTFTVSLEGTDWIDDYITTFGVTTNLYFNNATNNFVYIWTDSTSATHYGCMKVDESNRTGKFLLSDTCVNSASGTILYNVQSLNNGSTFTAIGYLKFDSEIITNTVQIITAPTFSLYHNYPLVALFMAAILCLVLFLMGIPQPAISLSLLGLGVIFTSLLGWWLISAMQVGSIIFLIIVQLYLMDRK